jgi:hypothetical protein
MNYQTGHTKARDPDCQGGGGEEERKLEEME